MVLRDFEERGTAESFARAADNDDAIDFWAFNQALGELGESFDRPTFARPTRSRSDDGVSLWVFNNEGL